MADDDTAAHDLRVESGGGGCGRWMYAYCPCGWVSQTDNNPSGYSRDRLAVAFAAHLRSLDAKR